MFQIISIFNFLISLLKNIKGNFQSDTKNEKANHPHDTSHQSQWFGDNKLFSQVNRNNEDSSEVFMIMYNQFILSIMDWSKQSHVMPLHFLFDASQRHWIENVTTLSKTLLPIKKPVLFFFKLKIVLKIHCFFSYWISFFFFILYTFLTFFKCY